MLTGTEWALLQQELQSRNISQREAVASVRRDAVKLVRRSLSSARASGELSESAERVIRWLFDVVHFHKTDTWTLDVMNRAKTMQEVEYLASMRNIRQGRIPTVKSTMVLPPDEHCYIETPATYHQLKKSGTVEVPGRLIVTSKKILFITQSGGGEIPLSKVLNVTFQPTGIFLELSRRANNGFYVLADSKRVGEIILSAVRLATHRLTGGKERDTRSISQDIKTAVWQRDQGRCVQCHATEYLEFDHVIPHSKGGATSVNNLQLLCRKCNLAKGDRI